MFRVERKHHSISLTQLKPVFLAEAFQRIVGVTPAFMRPPYGSYNQRVLDVSGARGQSVATWDFE